MASARNEVPSSAHLPDQLNIASYFIDRNLELGRQNKIAIYEQGRQLRYGQLAQMVNRAGNALQSLGVQPEDRVLLALPDSAEFVATFFGVAKIGAIPVPLNPATRPGDFLYFVMDTGAKAFVALEERWPPLQGVLGQARRLRHVLLVPSACGEVPGNVAEIPAPASFCCWSFPKLLEEASPELEAQPTSRDDIAFVLYTSGSTGEPKGVVHLQHDMLMASQCYASAILRIQEQDITFSVPKLFFAFGLGAGMYFPFGAGAATVLNPHRAKPETVFEYIEKFRPTLFFGVPTLFASLLHTPGPRDLSSIRFAASGGEVLAPEIFCRFRERFGIPLHDAIGSTEMLHLFISNPPGEIRPGSSGKVVPGYEAKIVGDDGCDVTAGQIGNLWMKGDSSAPFYWRKHDLTKRTMVGEWVFTGDKFYRDQDGYYYFCGRADDMLKVSGYWVSPAEVENALLGFPGVREVAVVSQKDENGLMKPKAFVVMNERADSEVEEELRNFLRDRLPGYKCPQWFAFLNELPKTATGKIQRFKLRASESA